ncbi:MAG: efflux RND transporter periplasmic adaptor subunit [Paraglaciecola sp.]|uniref:efflux RND transporter periplasmic adaptor subunit n=1 Tax=Paraglaciecola sp. TaxID=1920173 RepID=UPI00273FD4AB|nr:efflux RND transporter periplasmic adaptor subunit [Paraglaciecola sp.]MDP5032225.1 efflux RND transporter periplasmic adaptor subunit [Paraglaciecola sp.]MDP5133373.1 efflux RND transporter periplasmic adaptor subunit [Paraglaciecola sp.]
MRITQIFKALALGAVASVVLMACDEDQRQAQSQGQGLPQVTVAKVINERITEWDEFTGRLQAPQTVELIPRVSGYIDSVVFNEGALVKAGQLLFIIDDRAFKAEVARLKAELSSATTAAELAKSNFIRGQQLSAQKAMSAELLDSRRAAQQQAQATVASVQAALTRAELDLSYSKITAPISGRVSYANITAGNFVTAGVSQLTHIVSTEHMHAYFDIDEQTYLKYAQLTNSGQRADARDEKANPVYMALANETDYSHIGQVDFVDNRVNQQTGTIRVRASFPNTDHQLIPGLFAHLKLVGSKSYHGILIDEKAIGTDLNNKFVLVLNENTLEYRPVTLGDKLNGLRIVTGGLSADDKIVVNGLQRVRPNMQIEPKLVEMSNPEILNDIRNAQLLLDQTQTELAANADDSVTRS